jgi:hypothetical protein
MDDWLKLPGLFYRSEFEQVIEADGEHEYLFAPAGRDDQQRELFAIYCRSRGSGHPVQLDIPRVHPKARPAAARGAA